MKTYELVLNVKAYDLAVSINAETEEEAIVLAEQFLLEKHDLLNHDAAADIVTVQLMTDADDEVTVI
jgi:hypothetical protein